MGVMALPAMTTSPDDTPDIDAISERLGNCENGEKDSVSFAPSERYAKRMIGVFEDVCRLGYI
jgi:hypothetical protein